MRKTCVDPSSRETLREVPLTTRQLFHFQEKNSTMGRQYSSERKERNEKRCLGGTNHNRGGRTTQALYERAAWTGVTAELFPCLRKGQHASSRPLLQPWAKDGNRMQAPAAPPPTTTPTAQTTTPQPPTARDNNNHNSSNKNYTRGRSKHLLPDLELHVLHRGSHNVLPAVPQGR